MRKGNLSKSQLEGLFCRHPHRICMQDRIEGFDFCVDHILQDKNAPFKQCNFVSSKSGEKCTRAAPKADKKDGYCKEHTRKATVLRYRASLKSKPKDPAQQILDELDYYLPGTSKELPDDPVSTIGKLLDYGSGSDSDMDSPQLDQSYQADYDSDADSVDSEPEDALRYAEVYTAEEVALITRDKLIRLQSLYINQFKRLQHLLKEKRREFLANLKKETPIYGPNLGRISDAKEKKRLKKLKAMVSYRKRKGHCALLHRKAKDRRIKATPDYQGPERATKLPVCTFQSEDEQKCDEACIPLTKYCMNHVFLDPHQVLYKRCSKASGICQRVAVPYAKGRSCMLHQEVPLYIPRVWRYTRLQKRREAASVAKEVAPVSYLEMMDTCEDLIAEVLSLPSTSKGLPFTTPRVSESPHDQEMPSASGITHDTQPKTHDQEMPGASGITHDTQPKTPLDNTAAPDMSGITHGSLPKKLEDSTAMPDVSGITHGELSRTLHNNAAVPGVSGITHGAMPKAPNDTAMPAGSGITHGAVPKTSHADTTMPGISGITHGALASTANTAKPTSSDQPTTSIMSDQKSLATGLTDSAATKTSSPSQLGPSPTKSQTAISLDPKVSHTPEMGQKEHTKQGEPSEAPKHEEGDAVDETDALIDVTGIGGSDPVSNKTM